MAERRWRVLHQDVTAASAEPRPSTQCDGAVWEQGHGLAGGGGGGGVVGIITSVRARNVHDTQASTMLTGRARGCSRGLNLLLRASGPLARFSTSLRSRSKSMGAGVRVFCRQWDLRGLLRPKASRARQLLAPWTKA